MKLTGQTENAIKHRTNAGDKADVANDITVASILNNRFCIPLDFEILESSLPLYQYGLGSHLTYELTFANYSDVIKAMVHVPNFGGLSGSEDRGGGDNSIQFINFGRVGDKSFEKW